MNIDSDTVHWFLSTFAQTFAALIAILGALSVYRLQLLSNLRRSVRERLVSPLSQVAANAPRMSSTKLIELWKNYPEKSKKNLEASQPEIYQQIMLDFPTLENSAKEDDLIKRWLFGTIIPLLTLIATSIFSIFYTCWLVNNPLVLIVSAAIVLSFSLVATVVYIRILFRYEQEKRVRS
jgi:hypothetical protein